MINQPLRLTVLGCATPYPSVDNPCSGYLLSSGDTHVWVDAGTGTLGQLQRHVRLDELAAIWISHLHADHSADLLTAYYGALFADIQLAAPIPLYGPPGIADRLAHFLTNTTLRSPIESAFAITELHDGHRVEVGPLTLTSQAVSHGIPAFALRVAVAGRSLVYSGDTAPCDSLTRLADGGDVLLCEAESAQVPAEGEQVHHTPEDAGDTASAAGVGRLIVTHVGRFLSPQEAVARASTRFDGPVDYAAPGATFEIDQASRTRRRGGFETTGACQLIDCSGVSASADGELPAVGHVVGRAVRAPAMRAGDTVDHCGDRST
ncbi:MBL fold metallo-hydrolase [Micromonospora polyrhachis]|uniref:Ribonuclease BN (tRNA processing enzyme) n=1 Tax=Micromonospora polyrhachis TaxID=1282883 RepID=A0A7W7SYF0_9ACTN|nr:ribonuclease BN (tRNA processing enzyme) [Micromonospora polyrhachis]